MASKLALFLFLSSLFIYATLDTCKGAKTNSRRLKADQVAKKVSSSVKPAAGPLGVQQKSKLDVNGKYRNDDEGGYNGVGDSSSYGGDTDFGASSFGSRGDTDTYGSGHGNSDRYDDIEDEDGDMTNGRDGGGGGDRYNSNRYGGNDDDEMPSNENSQTDLDGDEDDDDDDMEAMNGGYSDMDDNSGSRNSNSGFGENSERDGGGYGYGNNDGDDGGGRYGNGIDDRGEGRREDPFGGGLKKAQKSTAPAKKN